MVMNPLLLLNHGLTTSQEENEDNLIFIGIQDKLRTFDLFYLSHSLMT
jgi:hypothetical protein